MNRERGTRPDGLVIDRDATNATLVARLGDRTLFRLPDFAAISAEEVVVDWGDLDRYALADRSPSDH